MSYIAIIFCALKSVNRTILILLYDFILSLASLSSSMLVPTISCVSVAYWAITPTFDAFSRYLKASTDLGEGIARTCAFLYMEEKKKKEAKYYIIFNWFSTFFKLNYTIWSTFNSFFYYISKFRSHWEVLIGSYDNRICSSLVSSWSWCKSCWGGLWWLVHPENTGFEVDDPPRLVSMGREDKDWLLT